MPKHVIHYDFEDFKRFILEDLTRLGYAPAPGQKPELADLAQINEPDDLEVLMSHTIMTVEVIPGGAISTTQAPTMVANPVAQARQVEPKSSKRGNAIKHGWYSKKVELTPEQKEERAAHFRMKRREAKERQRQAKQAQKPQQLELAPPLAPTVSAELVEIIPAQEVVAASPFPFQRSGQSNPHNVPSRSFLQQNNQPVQNSHGVRVVGEAF